MLLPKLRSVLNHLGDIFLARQTLALQANMERGKIEGDIRCVQAVLCTEIDDQPDRPALGVAVLHQPRHSVRVGTGAWDWKSLL